MKLLVETISRLGIDWNKRPLAESDFYRLCKRHKVTVQEIPLQVSGFYYSVLGDHFIAVDSKLPPQKKLFVMFHEFAHFLFHVPESGATANFHGIGRKTRKEIEADAFALCALIPTPWLEPEKLAELMESHEFDHASLQKRVEIFRRFGF